MAQRSSATRRIPGNPLGSVLREHAQQLRSTTRRSTVTTGGGGATAVAGEQGETGATGPAGPPGPQGPPGHQGPAAPMDTVQMMTGATGVATWTYPGGPYATVPNIAVAVVGTTPSIITISSVGTASVTVHTWNLAGTPANRLVHITAFPG